MLDEMLKIELFYEESLSLWLTENSSWVKKEDSKSKIGCKPLEEFLCCRLPCSKQKKEHGVWYVYIVVTDSGWFFSLSL